MTVLTDRQIDTNTNLDVRKLSESIGAEVSGLDLTNLNTETVTALRSLLLTHKALVFRGQPLSLEQQREVARVFGTLTLAHPTVAKNNEAADVLTVDSERNVANVWHTDVTFIVNPPAVSTLRSQIVTPYGGETLIADTAAAYRSLPEPLRVLADSLWAEHTNVHDYVTAGEHSHEEANTVYRAEFTSTEFRTHHPIVRVHPETGEPSLLVGGFAQRILGVNPADSRALIDLFQRHITRPRNVIRVNWQPDQLIVFDNRTTQHFAIDNYGEHPRRLSRVTVAGGVTRSRGGESGRSIVGDASHYSPLS